jgi:hypothetical protein
MRSTIPPQLVHRNEHCVCWTCCLNKVSKPNFLAKPLTQLLNPTGFVAQGEKQHGTSLLELSVGKDPTLGRLDVLFEVFLFSLSLSTTFGGSRLDARSPFCLLVANINTLMAQLMFVFLSGAGKSDGKRCFHLFASFSLEILARGWHGDV